MGNTTWLHRSAIAGATLFTLACAGMDLGLGPSITVNLPEAGGLTAGHPVTLNGIEIGSVRAVDFAETGDGVQAVLAIKPPDLARLDPETLFVVRKTDLAEPTHVMVANNICVETPRGLIDQQQLNGYAGAPARILFSAGRDHPQCASRLAEKLIQDLEDTIYEMDNP